MIDFMIDMLRGVKGEVSSKRVITFLAFVWVGECF